MRGREGAPPGRDGPCAPSKECQPDLLKNESGAGSSSSGIASPYEQLRALADKIERQAERMEQDRLMIEQQAQRMERDQADHFRRLERLFGDVHKDIIWESEKSYKEADDAGGPGIPASDEASLTTGVMDGLLPGHIPEPDPPDSPLGALVPVAPVGHAAWRPATVMPAAWPEDERGREEGSKESTLKTGILELRSRLGIGKEASKPLPNPIDVQARELEMTPAWLRWIRSHTFDAAMGMFIVLNTLVMALELEYRGSVQALDRLTVTTADSEYSTPRWEGVENGFVVCEHFFCLVFLLELILRVMAFRRRYFTIMSNWLDIVVVGAAVLDLYLRSLVQALLPDTAFLRLIRVCRLLKVLRMVRTMTLFFQLRLLILSIVSSLGALAWSIMFLTVIQVIVAIFMAQTLHYFIMDPANSRDTRQLAYHYFGRFSSATLTMFELTMAPGAWAKIGRILIFDVNWAYLLVFIPYGWLVTFTVIRVISALFLKHTLHAVAVDPEAAMREKDKKKKRELQQMRSIFTAADVDGSNTLSLDEFRHLKDHPRLTTILSTLEIDVNDAERLFHLITLDGTGDGNICVDEFIHGAVRVRGNARAVDMIELLYHQQRLQAQLASLEGHVKNISFGRADEAASGTPQLK